MEKVEWKKDVPVVGNYDVVVCGGGPAGFIAAVAAAREGARVALVEQYGFLGGMATMGYVAPLSVFTYNGAQVIGGIPWEFVQRLEAMGGGYVERPLGNVAFDPELYKLCVQRMVLEAGVALYLHACFSGCRMDGGRVTHVFIESKNGTEALAAKVFIDATGDADLAASAGVPMQPREQVPASADGAASTGSGPAAVAVSFVPAPLQPVSTYFILSGVDTAAPRIREAMHHNRQGVNCQCESIRAELLAHADEWGLPDFGGPWFCTTLHEGSVTVNMTRTSVDACDNRAFGAAECRLREDVFRMRVDRVSDSRFERMCLLSFIERDERAEPLVSATDQEVHFLHQRMFWRVSMREPGVVMPEPGDELLIHIPAEHLYVVSR